MLRITSSRLRRDPEVALRVIGRGDHTGSFLLFCISTWRIVVGNVAAVEENAATLASTLGIVVVSVEYRLAPEHPFPAALHDCVAV